MSSATEMTTILPPLQPQRWQVIAPVVGGDPVRSELLESAAAAHAIAQDWRLIIPGSLPEWGPVPVPGPAWPVGFLVRTVAAGPLPPGLVHWSLLAWPHRVSTTTATACDMSVPLAIAEVMDSAHGGVPCATCARWWRIQRDARQPPAGRHAL